MLRRLLKYDLRATYKLSLTLLVAAIASSFVGSLCLYYIRSRVQSDEFELLDMAVNITTFISIIAVIIALAMIPVTVFTRFYKNLYTDEGYLTFTLPASRFKIHLSKTLTALIWAVAVMIVGAACVEIFFIMVPEEGGILFYIFETFLTIISVNVDAGWTVGYAVLMLILIIIIEAIAIATVQLAITVGALWAKKAKVLVGAACYYVVSSVISFAAEMALLIGLSVFGDPIFSFLDSLESNLFHVVSMLLILFVIVCAFGVFALIFATTQRMIDKRLNLA